MNTRSTTPSTSPTPTPKSVAVLGLGSMGSRMATALARAGHPVTVWNRTEAVARDVAAADGLDAVPTIADAVAAAEVTVAMLTDDDASRDVWGRALPHLPAGAIVVEASTVSPERAREWAATMTAAGLRPVEAPVVGSRPQADAGALFTLAAGAPADVTEAGEVLEAYSAAVRPTGAPGSAAVVKLAINSLFAVQVAAYGEIIGLLEAEGLADEAMYELLAGLPITSPGLSRVVGVVGQRDWAPNFPLDLVRKDLGYAMSLADELGTELPLTTAASAAVASAVAAGDGGLDIVATAKQYLPTT